MEIKLSGKKGGIMLVSEEDYEELSKCKLYLNKYGYAYGKIEGKTRIVHVYIMKSDYSKNEVVDHINCNKLDNTRENLRITTTQKNNENKNIYKTKTSSIYHGVFFAKKQNKYRAVCRINGKRVNLGSYDDEIQAAKIRDAYVIQSGATHMKLNFPDENGKSDAIVPKTKSNENGFKGVHVTLVKNYAARITVNKKEIHLGCFKTAEEAARAYDKYIIDNNIASCKLNFPEDNQNYDPKSKVKTFFKKIDDKTIELNDGIIIDEEDYDKIKYYKIYLDKSGYGLMFTNKTLKLHRFIMDESDPKKYVDHIDGNKLNNSKSNLRLSNAKLNGQNKTSSKNKTSIYLGVCKQRPKKFRTVIVKEGKTIFRAYNSDEEIVARMRDIFILEYLKEDHYPINFKWTDEEKAEWLIKFNDAIDNKSAKIYT